MPGIVSIKEQIGLLVQLQAIDTQIYALRGQKEQIPLEIEKLQNDFEGKKAVLKTLDEKAKGLAAKRKEKELDLAVKEENIKKLNTQLFSLKTNKEYHAMLEQIAGLKADSSLLEEDILKLMDEQDTVGSALAKEKEVLAQEEKKLQEEKRKADERQKELEHSINDLTSKRSQITPSVDKHILSSYERILKAKDGLALVKVKGYSCQGCFINVTPQVINEIKMQAQLIVCEACARILYIDEDDF